MNPESLDYTKTYALTSAAGINPNPWANSITDVISITNSRSDFVKISDFIAIFKFRITGKANITDIVNMTVPGVAMFSHVSSTMNLGRPDGTTEVITQASQAGRGDAAYALQNIEYSYGKYNNNSKAEFLANPPIPISTSSFELRIPFKFLFDFAAMEDKYLLIEKLSIVYTWKSLLSVFQPPLNSPNFAITLSGIDYIYYTYTFHNPETIKKHLSIDMLSIPDRRMYVLKNTVLAGESTFSKNYSIPGIPVKMYYFFTSETPSSADGTAQGTYTLNPNDSAIVTQQQITAGDRIFPTNPIYNSKKSSTEQVGCLRHFDDFQKVSGHFDMDCDSILNYEEWLLNKRIYAVSLSGLPDGSNLNVNLTFDQPTTVLSNIVMVFVYKM